MRLKGKKVIITGAAGAIGGRLAVAFAAEGADVVVHYHRSENKAKEIVKKINSIGSKAIAVQGDLSKPETPQMIIDECVKEFGRLDIVINNAITGDQIPLLDLTLDVINNFFNTNLRGYFLMALNGARQMIKQDGRGWIVNISSISSRVVTSSYVHYAATKGGIEAATRGMAVALGRKGINVNCVAPGVVNTPTVKSMFEDPLNRDPVLERTPTGFITEIDDCVEPVLFLCTEGARAITGQVIDVDGGYSIQGMEWAMSEGMVDFRRQLETQGADILSSAD